jgi:hypothetical protein
MIRYLRTLQASCQWPYGLLTRRHYCTVKVVVGASIILSSLGGRSRDFFALEHQLLELRRRPLENLKAFINGVKGAPGLLEELENSADLHVKSQRSADGALNPRNFAYWILTSIKQCLAPRLSRSMATETQLPTDTPREYDPTFLHTATDPSFELPGTVSRLISAL